MSYARFGYNSDVYVYEAFDAHYIVHVGRNRKDCDFSPPVYKGDFPSWFEGYQDFLERYSVLPYYAINCPKDGQPLSADSAEECIALLKELQELGYRVPDHAFKSLEVSGMP